MSGLHPFTFALAVLGNLCYGLQIFITSVETDYLLRSLPWIVGSVGVMALDFTVSHILLLYVLGRDVLLKKEE